MKIHPVVAGICNAVVPGLGYLLIDERKVFGWLLLAGSLSCLALSFVEPAFLSQSFFVSTSLGGKFLEAAWYLCFVIAYGYDAWSLGMKKRAAVTALVVTTPPAA